MRVYPLDPGLTQEQMAVTFAMTSRSPDTFEEIAQRVTAESSAEFHERWTVGYGHASVAEHAVLHLAVEEVSRLAADAIEDCRLASYTEKSSRYQVMTQAGFHVPGELADRPAEGKIFEETCRGLFHAYENLLEAMLSRLDEIRPAVERETPRRRRERIRREATDAARSVLPAATLTNLGITANARELAHMVSKLLSSELRECRDLGELMAERAREQVPTLLRHVRAAEYLKNPAPVLDRRPGAGPALPGARLLAHDSQPYRRVAAAVMYGTGEWGDALETARRAEAMTGEECLEVIDRRMRGRDPREAAIREFELPRATFEFTLDYGACREFRRHRMQSAYPQPMTVGLGYTVPGPVEECRLEDEYRAAMELAEEGCRRAGDVGAYLVTHAHLQRVAAAMNLRELYHFLRLRTSAQAHPGIRGPAREARELLERAWPGMLRWLGDGE